MRTICSRCKERYASDRVHICDRDLRRESRSQLVSVSPDNSLIGVSVTATLTIPDYYKSEHHDAPILWARDLLSREDWVILDTDDTGLGETDESYRIAVISSTGKTLFNSFLKPKKQKRFYEGQLTKHGISYEELAKAPKYAEIAEVLGRILKKRKVISYNVSFRKRILFQTANKAGLAPLTLKWECAMEKYSRLAGQRRQDNEYSWQPLPGSQAQGIAKDSIGDCLAVLALIRSMAETPLLSEAPQRNQVDGSAHAFADEKLVPYKVDSPPTSISQPRPAAPVNLIAVLLLLLGVLAVFCSLLSHH